MYGGTGHPCTVAYRRARMAQYPQMAAKIAANCPRLADGASSCAACRWRGKNCYDCAQWTRRLFACAGVTLPSGATTQWKTADWAAKGALDSLPRGRVCCVFRRSGAGMSHTGLYLGDGSVTDARSHALGVLRQPLEKYPWTHWALPAGLYGGAEPPLFCAEVVCTGWLNLRAAPGVSTPRVGRAYPGSVVEVLEAASGWWRVRLNGQTAWACPGRGGARYLARLAQTVQSAAEPPESEAAP